MRRLVYLASARDDLRGILAYITRESGSVAVGRAFAARLTGKCASLATLPGTLGSARPELRPDIRSTGVGNYIIFFRYCDRAVEIVNILERHRDIGGFYGDE